jgi:putative lipase involved disintegration of autophagic bodies
MPSSAVAQPNSVEWGAEKLGCSVLPPAYPARSPIALNIFNRQQLRSFLCSLDRDIYADIASTYRPKGYAVISTGHSLGGALAAYVAHIFSGAAITFAVPGGQLALKRLGIRYMQDLLVQYGVTGDTIFSGTCTV